MTDRVRVYHRGGIGLADLRVTVERSAYINDEGEAEFDIVTNDPNCRREDYLNFGNWLLVESDKLEPWVGMIEHQELKRRYIHIRAFTPDRQLVYRNVPRQLRLKGKSGAVYRQILNLCNRAEETVIQAGVIWNGGPDMPEENLSGDNLRDYVIELAERAGAEYTFTPVPYNGQLVIEAHWLDRIGVDSPFSLEESYNLADEAYSIKFNPPEANEMWGYGAGAGQTDRPTSTYLDPDSRARYGLRQGSRTFSDYDTKDAVKNAIRNQINTIKEPERLFKLSMTDTGATWSQVQLGNIHPLRMWSVDSGLSTKVRVTGMYHNPYEGKVELINQEVINAITG